MFTGLIEELGVVEGLTPEGEGKILTVRCKKVLEGVKKGDSIAINGACQTVVQWSETSFSVFVSKVTLSVTTLGNFTPGRIVNLERALTLSSRLGGHIVQGHVDFKAKVKSLSRDYRGLEVDIAVPQKEMKYIVPKGSVAVDGISLTVVSVEESGFKLYLIPETLENTNIKTWKAGDEVNIETDILARYVESILKFSSYHGDDEMAIERDNQLLKKLAENGFL
ncbi:MAG TPA: riboflavin synthase [Spirochaetota bacterium]|jgi:riboflavin synthase|nr:riboflavin synthase [Spirochaetota bacterium]HRS63949.1 riboflavin synthase [Spirochaetota bacterium]HRU65087.1 riboflavin synthase [Spirochaetota bacterium]